MERLAQRWLSRASSGEQGHRACAAPSTRAMPRPTVLRSGCQVRALQKKARMWAQVLFGSWAQEVLRGEVGEKNEEEDEN